MGSASAAVADKALLSDGSIEEMNRLVIAYGGNVSDVAIANTRIGLQEVQRETHAFLKL